MRGAGRRHDDAGDDREFARLLNRAREGRADGFDELVRMMHRRLLAFARARGAHDPEAVANETLVQMCRSIGTFEGNRIQFRAWVYTIARNRLIDEHRRSERRVETEPLPDHLDVAVEMDIGADVLDQRERVEALLTDLTDEQREVLLLRVLGGLSVDETAAVVGRTPGAVRALQHRALQHLRQQLSTPATRNP